MFCTPVVDFAFARLFIHIIIIYKFMQAVLEVFDWCHWKQLYEGAEQLLYYISTVLCVFTFLVCHLSCQPITFTYKFLF